MNLNAGNLMAVPGGYPIRLLTAIDAFLSGVVPKAAVSVTAIVQPEFGSANVHLALYAMPSTTTGSDGAQVARTDVVGATSTTPTTVVVTAPTGVLPAPYVVRLWVDGVTGTSQDTVSRDGTTAVAVEPRIPAAVRVLSVIVQ